MSNCIAPCIIRESLPVWQTSPTTRYSPRPKVQSDTGRAPLGAVFGVQHHFPRPSLQISGVFLREITKRLIEGLADVFPDLQERIDHIFTSSSLDLQLRS